MICMDQKGEILIKPCGHTAFCEKCITHHIKTSNLCPMCRTTFKKLYLLEFDEENQCYMACGSILVK